MNTTASRTTHDYVNERLPWYVNGTLSEEERVRVAAHVEECPVCRDDLALCREMSRAVRSDGAVPIPPAASADALLQQIERQASPRWLPDWRVAAGIAVIAFAAALALLQYVGSEPPNQQFRTVTQETSAATVDYVFQLQFAASTDNAARDRLLHELGGNAQAMDADRREYRVTLSLPPQSLADLDARAAEIAAREEVESADVVALQVPVR